MRRLKQQFSMILCIILIVTAVGPWQLRSVSASATITRGTSLGANQHYTIDADMTMTGEFFSFVFSDVAGSNYDCLMWQFTQSNENIRAHRGNGAGWWNTGAGDVYQVYDTALGNTQHHIKIDVSATGIETFIDGVSKGKITSAQWSMLSGYSIIYGRFGFRTSTTNESAKIKNYKVTYYDGYASQVTYGYDDLGEVNYANGPGSDYTEAASTSALGDRIYYLKENYPTGGSWENSASIGSGDANGFVALGANQHYTIEAGLKLTSSLGFVFPSTDGSGNDRTLMWQLSQTGLNPHVGSGYYSGWAIYGSNWNTAYDSTDLGGNVFADNRIHHVKIDVSQAQVKTSIDGTTINTTTTDAGTIIGGYTMAYSDKLGFRTGATGEGGTLEYYKVTFYDGSGSKVTHAFYFNDSEMPCVGPYGNEAYTDSVSDGKLTIVNSPEYHLLEANNPNPVDVIWEEEKYAGLDYTAFSSSMPYAVAFQEGATTANVQSGSVESDGKVLNVATTNVTAVPAYQDFVVNGKPYTVAGYDGGAYFKAPAGRMVNTYNVVEVVDANNKIRHFIIKNTDNGSEILQNTKFQNLDSNPWNEYTNGASTFTNQGDGSLDVRVQAYNGGDNWNTQLVQSPLTLDTSKYYVATCTISSDVDKSFQLLMQTTDYQVLDVNELITVPAGEAKTVKVAFSPTSGSQYLYGIMMGFVNNTVSDAANVTISNVSLKAYDSEAVAKAVAARGVADEDAEANWRLVPGSANYYYNNNNTEASVVNVQTPGGAAEEGIYMTLPIDPISSVKVNGTTLDSSKYYANGAGVSVYLSAFNEGVNEVEINYGSNRITTIQIRKDAGTASTGFSSTGNQWMAWEKERCDYLSWNAIDGATYAIYVDGNLYVKDITDTSYNVPAYALIDMSDGVDLDMNGQKATKGAHSISVISVTEGQSVPDSFADVSEARVIGTDEFNLNVNYIYGNTVDIWNQTGVPNKWNFTITPGDDNQSSGMKVYYNSDGSVDLTNLQSAGDWQLKAAIYDSLLEREEEDGLVNIAFDIIINNNEHNQETLTALRNGSKTISIGIKSVAEEVINDNGNYRYAKIMEYSDTHDGKRWVYQDPHPDANDTGIDPGIDNDAAWYDFVYNEKTNTAVLHYSFSFDPVQDTYDLLFDLNGLKDVDITLSDAITSDIYKVTEAFGSPIPNVSDESNSSIIVNWNTNIPDRLLDYYDFKTYIKESGSEEWILVDEGTDVIRGKEYSGYAPGTYDIKVESYYENKKTGEATTTTTIPREHHPNLVVSEISIPGGPYYVGDEVPIKVTVKNIGTANVNLGEDAFTTSVSVKGNDVTTFVIDRHTFGKTVFARGDRYEYTYKYILTEADIGNVVVGAFADSLNDVSPELSETDNRLSARYTFYGRPDYDVEVQGFQMNTNKNESGASRNNPAFRVVCRVSDSTIGGKKVQKCGVIYALTDKLMETDNLNVDTLDKEELRSKMTYEQAESDTALQVEDNIQENPSYLYRHEFSATARYAQWTSHDEFSKGWDFYALTVVGTKYNFNILTQYFSFRAYAELEDGSIVYGETLYTVNPYEIAQDLYEDQKISSKEGHDFLYTNVLNVVTINANRRAIAMQMMEALKVEKNANDPKYQMANYAYKDMMYYAYCQNGYTYNDREDFAPIHIATYEEQAGASLLTLLNAASEKEYESIFDWIYYETNLLYTKVPYVYDNAMFHKGKRN